MASIERERGRRVHYFTSFASEKGLWLLFAVSAFPLSPGLRFNWLVDWLLRCRWCDCDCDPLPRPVSTICGEGLRENSSGMADDDPEAVDTASSSWWVGPGD